MKRFLGIIISVFVFVVLANLPVVPISVAPVMPNQLYTVRMKTFYKILRFAIYSLDGVSYQWNLWTIVVILALLAIGCLVSVFVFRKIGDFTNK